jgi:hypothetical protein
MNEKSVTSHNGMQVLGTDLLLGLASQSVALGLDTLSAALTESLVLGTLSIHLLLEDTLTLTLGLGLLDLYMWKRTSQCVGSFFSSCRGRVEFDKIRGGRF